MKINFFEVQQPIGTFYLSVVNAKKLIKVTETRAREIDSKDVQREFSPARVNEIADYCRDPDATFPTSIIISIKPEAFKGIFGNSLEFLDDTVIGEILDGQHRLLGLEKSGISERFDLPVVFMFDLDNYQKGYVFSIINSKQTRVNPSLIYDLFALSHHRSPYKTCHEIVRNLNRDKESPFFDRIKMLGRKEEHQEKASLSQSAFINYLVPLISKKPEQDAIDIKNEQQIFGDSKLIFRDYFIHNEDHIILKILLNYFNAISKVFHCEWNDPDKYILSKPIGYGALLKVLPFIFNKGDMEGDLSERYFTNIYNQVKYYFYENNIEITSNQFGSNEQARTKLAKLILEALS
ncbi:MULTISPECIES: DGQHR domain-containing protein [Acinetobacter]|uniref:DGQHR domain-containing protein n=1 Tax=Acinetobacter TaxID=469 RepID=UPI0014797D4A|nr:MULTISPECIES: DGQHR domain-containing protein [Acinetobacter]UGQ30571.1 DGQHR domain-containing protein [Acinetobacter calcoaceticus]